jgi:putative ABC transport system permease protein
MIANYIKIAFKVLGRRKLFTFISLFGISLTLVVLMVATAILDNVFSPRSPESRFDHVLVIYSMGIYGPQGSSTGNPGYGFLQKTMRDLPSAQETSFFSTVQPSVIYHDGRKVETHLRWTDGAYWKILDFHFLEGGPFTQDDDDKANRVAVITDDLREKLFGGAPALGKSFELDGARYRVVGVVPEVPITRIAGFSEIWMPNMTQKGDHWKTQQMGDYSAAVLTRSAADAESARRELRERLTHYAFDDPKAFDRVVAGLDTPFEAFARSMVGNDMKGRQATILRLIFILSGLLFVTLPTMNLVSINLSRIMERASEIGVRKTFGASSRALVGQFVLENVVLTVIGGVIGFALSVVALRLMARTALLPHAIFDVNLRIFFYGLLLAAAFGIFSGVYPAWRMSRMQPVDALRGGAA